MDRDRINEAPTTPNNKREAGEITCIFSLSSNLENGTNKASNQI